MIIYLAECSPDILDSYLDKLFISARKCGTIGVDLCPLGHNKQRYRAGE